jgi:hypothetical protein
MPEAFLNPTPRHPFSYFLAGIALILIFVKYYFVSVRKPQAKPVPAKGGGQFSILKTWIAASLRSSQWQIRNIAQYFS